MAALTDDTGTIVEAATYDTYGKVAVYDESAQAVEESPVGNPYYFTGRRLDLLPTVHSPQPIAKQLYHYRAREYDPGNGRFLQRDPLSTQSRSGRDYDQGLNLYDYVRSNPGNHSGSSGLRSEPPPPCPTCGNDRYPHSCTSRPPGLKCDDCWKTCQASQHLLVGDGGGWLCRADGCRCACVNNTEFPSTGKPDDEALRKCVIVHEEDHVHRKGWDCSCSPKPCRGGSQPGQRMDRECHASAAEINCLCGERAKCGTDKKCIKRINMAMKHAKDYCRSFGGNAYNYGAKKCP